MAEKNELILKIKTFNELTLHELYEILKIRNEVFMIEQRIEYNDTDDIDFECIHIMFCEKSGKVAAYSRAIPAGKIGKHAAFGRVCVRTEYRKTGLGRKLVAKVIDCIEDRFGENDIEIGAQAYLEKFYGSFGFKTVSDVFSIGGIDHVKMLKEKN
jgi:ElaA protein